MKKKSLKSLNLNKKTISKFQATNINGGSTPCVLTPLSPYISQGLSALGFCDLRKPDEDTFKSGHCITQNNENTCECTIA